MTVDDPFFPVDPVSSMIGPWKVVPRRRRFGPKSRELYKKLNQIQKELKDGDEPPPPSPAGSPESDPPEKSANFDHLA
jgi:hypothetical protein